MTIDRPTAAQLPQLKALWQEAFGDSEAFAEVFFENGFRFDRSLVACEERVLGAVYWFDCTLADSRYAYVYALGVTESARGKGVGSRLTQALHSHLALLGYDGCLLCPANEGLFAYYDRLGYETCACMGQFRCQRGEAVPLQKLTPTEYAARRAAFLPPNSAQFEAFAYAYLGAYTDLYAGDGFVLAAYRDGETLIGSELLGDTRKAPGILAALDCATGVFKTPGNAPHVMFCPLRPHAVAPAYLGLVLD